MSYVLVMYFCYEKSVKQDQRWEKREINTKNLQGSTVCVLHKKLGLQQYLYSITPLDANFQNKPLTNGPNTNMSLL